MSEEHESDWHVELDDMNNHPSDLVISLSTEATTSTV
jgi:hypothetical protein